MIEESKYYTPIIEEFHVGFEYQVRYNGYWYKRNLMPASDNYKKLDLNDYRVKYLDRSDIESLGWEPDYERAWILEGNDRKSSFYKEDGSLTFHPDKHLVCIRSSNQVFSLLKEVSTFSIKNRSELKKLMQQLNISE